MDTILNLHETLSPYYAVGALLLTWLFLGIAWWRGRSQWHNKEFLGQVNFSLNLFGETLSMRTLKETETLTIWPNQHGIGLLRKAAQRTTVENPFIYMTSQEDRDYLHRAIKNALSQLCPEAFIATALGVPIRAGVFVFALTCERYPEMRTVKIRVLVVERDTLREWCAPGGKGESLPMTPYYVTRLRTLQAMYQMDATAQAGGEERLGRIELAVPTV